MEKKPLNIFDHLRNITLDKGPFLGEEGWNNYMTHRFISMNRDYVEIANTIQKNIRLTPEQCYIVYKEIIPKRFIYLKYMKSKGQKWDVILLEILSKYWECSFREAKENINILGLDEIKKILVSLGKSDLEIEKLLE